MSFINIADETRHFNTYQVSKIDESYTEMMNRLNISVCVPSFVVNFRRLLLAEYNFRVAVKALAIDRTVKDSGNGVAVVNDQDGDHYDSYVEFDVKFIYVEKDGGVKISARMYVSGILMLERDFIYSRYIDININITRIITYTARLPGCVNHKNICPYCLNLNHYKI